MASIDDDDSLEINSRLFHQAFKQYIPCSQSDFDLEFSARIQTDPMLRSSLLTHLNIDHFLNMPNQKAEQARTKHIISIGRQETVLKNGKLERQAISDPETTLAQFGDESSPKLAFKGEDITKEMVIHIHRIVAPLAIHDFMRLCEQNLRNE